MHHPSDPSELWRGARRTLITLFAAAGLLTSVAAAQTTIDFWSPFTGPDGETIEAMVEAFNTTTGQAEGVEVNLLIVPWDEYYTKLTVAMASRQAPDLAIAHSHRIAGFVAEGALTPYTPEELEVAGIKGEDFIPALWNAGEIDGSRYAVPIDAFPRHLFYNRALFEQAGLDPDQPPQNLESLLEDAQRISELGDDVYGLYFAQEGSWVARDFYTVYWQFADDLLAPDMASVSADFEQAATETLELMTSFKGEYGVSPQQNVEYQPLFLQGKVGIAFAQITDLPLFQNVADFDYGVAPFPTLGDQPATFALGHNFIIPLGQSDEALAADMTFVRWFSENSLAWTIGGKVPASFTVLDSAEFADLPDQSAVASQLDTMRLPPTIAQQPTIDRIVQETIEAVYAGNLSVEAAVARMSQGIDEALTE